MKKIIGIITLLLLVVSFYTAYGVDPYGFKNSNLKAKKVTADSIRVDGVLIKPVDFIPIPTDGDTTVDVTNKKLLITPRSLTTAGLDSSTFIDVYDYNTVAIADSVGLGKLNFISFNPDSLIFYAWSDSISKLIGAHVTITGRNGTVVLTQTVSPTVTGGWQRFCFYRASAVIPQDYFVVYRIKDFKGKTFRITPIYMKKAG